MSDSKAADVSTEVLVDPEAVAQASDDAAEEIAVDNADNDSEQNALSLAAEQAAEGDDPESVALESDGISTTDSGPIVVKRKDDKWDFDLSAFNAVANEVPFQKKRDKLFFTLGVMNVCTIAFAAGGYPWFLPIFYSIKFPILIGARFVLYKPRKWHYFLFDFCYFENTILLAYMWFFGHSEKLFMINFAMTHGPLAWAVLVFHNSLVFHSLDKMTSAFIHYTPLSLTYLIRWYGGGMVHEEFNVCDPAECPSPFLWLVVYPTAVFAVYQVLYWVCMSFICCLPKDPEYLTSFRYITSNTKGMPYKVTHYFGKRWAPFMFSAVYTVCAFISMLPVWFYYRYQAVGFIFAALVLVVLVHNGASFYVEVFSRGYGNKKKKAGPPKQRRTHSVLLS